MNERTRDKRVPQWMKNLIGRPYFFVKSKRIKPKFLLVVLRRSNRTQDTRHHASFARFATRLGEWKQSPDAGRMRKTYQRFLLTFTLLGASLLFCALCFVGLYQWFSSGTVRTYLTSSGLFMTPQTPDDALGAGEGTTLSEGVLRQGFFFPPTMAVSHLFTTSVPQSSWGADWEEEQNGSLLPSVIPQITPDGADGELYAYSEEDVPQGMAGIMPIDLCTNDFSVSNDTDYTIDLGAYAEEKYPLASMTGTKDEPAVLILHTHATECYASDDSGYYNPDADVTRTTDPEKNMVAVGEVLAQTLEAQGIHVIHLTEQFDAESYTESYTYAAQAIRAQLELHPSISYVLDVHRDSMVRSDGTKLRPVTMVGSQPAAQVMLVIGTDEGGGSHPNWRDNLTVAAHLQKKMLDSGTGLARPLNLRRATFNEQYTTGSMLVEIGTTGNTLDEAKTAAKTFGQMLGELILRGNATP